MLSHLRRGALVALSVMEGEGRSLGCELRVQASKQVTELEGQPVSGSQTTDETSSFNRKDLDLLKCRKA